MMPDILKGKKRGFTLLELIIVIAIVGVLVGIVVPKCLGFIEKSKMVTDQVNLKILNTATFYYGAMQKDTCADIFENINADNERMETLIDEDYINTIIETEQEDASFQWKVENQIWRLYVGEILVPLTPFGDTFDEISTGMIDYIKGFYNKNGNYGLSWNDPNTPEDDRYMTIGLNSDDWNIPINHAHYVPVGSRIQVAPEAGYKLYFERLDGSEHSLSSGNNIVYDFYTEYWYGKSIEGGIKIDISTLQIKKIGT